MGEDLNVVVIGATGGIGMALVNALNSSTQVAQIFALSRKAAQASRLKSKKSLLTLPMRPALQRSPKI